MRTRVKICGFTQVDEALFAARAGVDAVGLVFYPHSPRGVDIGQGRAIAAAMPAFTTVVALFVDADPAWIREVLAQVAVGCLQFHGDEPAEACRIYHKPYLKAVRMRPGVDVRAVAAAYGDAAGLLVDAYHPSAPGGTGVGFDWTLLPGRCPLPVILAGGLDAGNVAAAIGAARPYGVDVSSGVEMAKGRKDLQKMTAFINAVNATSAGHDD